MGSNWAGGKEDKLGRLIVKLKLDPEKKTKKPYQTPVLKTYGSVQALTATVSFSGNSDNGTGTMFRTH
jgi:hypothetical protein